MSEEARWRHVSPLDLVVARVQNLTPCRYLSLKCRIYLEACQPHEPCSGTCDCGARHQCQCICHKREREREEEQET